jgi:hypothetical protein
MFCEYEPCRGPVGAVGRGRGSNKPAYYATPTLTLVKLITGLAPYVYACNLRGKKFERSITHRHVNRLLLLW